MIDKIIFNLKENLRDLKDDRRDKRWIKLSIKRLKMNIKLKFAAIGCFNSDYINNKKKFDRVAKRRNCKIIKDGYGYKIEYLKKKPKKFEWFRR